MKLFIGLFLVACVWAKHEKYDGHALYDVTVVFSDQSQLVYNLMRKLAIDTWSVPVPGRAGQVLVPKYLRQSFEKVLEDEGIGFSVAVENIKEKLDFEDSVLKRNGTGNSSYDVLSFNFIPTYDEVDAFMEDLARDYPDTVTIVNAGKSYDGIDIKYLKISSNSFQSSNKPVIFMQSLLHAREWVTLPVTLYAIKKLVTDVTEQNLVNDIDWIILPIANPDGYIFSYRRDRFWRKNRSYGSFLCRGVDLNRNFDIMWGQSSSSSFCMEDYHGTGPFSEPESAIIRDIFAEYGSKIQMYLDMHSYGSMILYGYGTGELPPNALSLHVAGVAMAQSIDTVKWDSKPNYRVGNIQLVLNYGASGGASDYGLAVGTPFSYTYELPAYRNMGSFDGFLVDPDFIEQVGYETWEGIKAGANYISPARNTKDKQ